MSGRILHRSATTLAASLLAVSGLLAGPVEPVSAHCPGTVPADGRDYSAGTRSIAGVATAKGIRGDINWTNPALCALPGTSLAFSLEVVNICNDGYCGGWVQVGWRKNEGQSAPQFYCEFKPLGGSAVRFYAPLSQASHAYKFQYDSFDAVWDCYLDGVGKFSKGAMGWASGTWLVVQGEVNSTHTQIGAVAPAKLLIFDMQYQNASGQWPAFDVANTTIEIPYGGDEPAMGQFRNWTSASH